MNLFLIIACHVWLHIPGVTLVALDTPLITHVLLKINIG